MTNYCSSFKNNLHIVFKSLDLIMLFFFSVVKLSSLFLLNAEPNLSSSDMGSALARIYFLRLGHGISVVTVCITIIKA